MQAISLPEAYLSQLREVGIDSIPNYLTTLQNQPPTSIRINDKKNAVLPFALQASVPWNPYGYYLEERINFGLQPLFHQGAFYVQEASSMVIHEVLQQLKSNLPEFPMVLDMCAAPGGKSTLLQQSLGDNALIVANEVDRKRAQILAENVTKWGANRLWVCSEKPEVFAQKKLAFHLILLDAPCSGEGMFRKDAFAREQWHPNLVTQCALTQKNILEDAWNALSPGGYLIYSTCTHNFNENEQQLAQFIANNNASNVPLSNAFEAFGVACTRHYDISAYRMWPHKVKGEGLFVSVLKKPGVLEAGTQKKKLQVKFATPWFDYAWNSPFEAKYVEKDNKQFVHFLAHSAELNLIDSSLYWLKFGTELGERFGHKITPHVAWALNSAASEFPFLQVDLDKESALQYLRLQSIHIPSTQKGIVLLTHENLGLGFVNHLGNRSNNLYPKNWKLRI